MYRQFCASIDSGKYDMGVFVSKKILNKRQVFTTLDLESNPLAEVKLPAREFLVQGTNELPPADEARFKEVIARLKTKIAERRPLLAPYFKDFDRVSSSCLEKKIMSNSKIRPLTPTTRFISETWAR